MFDKFVKSGIAGLCAVLALIGNPTIAGEQPAPKGGVILTVAGKIDHWNRGETNPARDKYLKHLNISFKQAMVFDADMLTGLPIHELRVATPAGENLFGGPLLSDVLAKAGVNGSSIKLTALDGSTTELTAEEIKKHEWILALLVDGKQVGIGDFGPLWLLHKPETGQTPSPEELQRWVWSVFYIEAL